VLLFDFADVTHGSSSTPEYYSGIVRAMNASFYRQSYEKMWIVGGEVYGWYKTSLSLGDLKVTTWYIDWTDAQKLETLAKRKAQDLHVSGIVFGVFAGPVWAWATGFPSALTIIGDGVHEGSWTWGLNGFMHEFGHNLGLPDLYNYEKLKAEPVGEWDLMDRGEEELSAYSRIKLGWLPRDSVTTIDSRRDLTVLINSLDSPNGMRALKVQLYASNSYYLVEARRKTDGLHLVVYYIKGVIESGKGSIVIETVLGASDKPVFVGNRIVCALIVLDAQPDELKIQLAREVQGKKAQEAFDALQSADESIASAWSSNRVQGLQDAKEELSKAWDSFHKGDFAAAKDFAEKASQLAESATTPQSYSQASELRQKLRPQMWNASFKSDEAIRYLTAAKTLMQEADDLFDKKDFDVALQKLLEAQENLSKAAEAEKASAQQTQAISLPIPTNLLIIVGAVVAIAIVALLLMRRKTGTASAATAVVSPAQPAPSVSPLAAGKFCINCGAPLPAPAVACETCGSKQ
jgi:tetratricopeptide (TPR) repeat protein